MSENRYVQECKFGANTAMNCFGVGIVRASSCARSMSQYLSRRIAAAAISARREWADPTSKLQITFDKRSL